MLIAITNIHSSGRLLRNRSCHSPLHSTLISVLSMHGTEASHHSSVYVYAASRMPAVKSSAQNLRYQLSAT